MLDAAHLRELLRYEPDTGIFRWKTSTNRRIKSGTVAGRLHPSGYWMIGIVGRKYTAGRLAWLYVNGAWPLHQIDHINRNKTDNRISNLRDVTDAENKLNVDRSSVARVRGRFARLESRP